MKPGTAAWSVTSAWILDPRQASAFNPRAGTQPLQEGACIFPSSSPGRFESVPFLILLIPFTCRGGPKGSSPVGDAKAITCSCDFGHSLKPSPSIALSLRGPTEPALEDAPWQRSAQCPKY